MKNYSLQYLTGILLYLIIIYVLYPYCKYYIDPDTSAYLVITDRFSEKDFVRAINGLWNPLHALFASFAVNLFEFSDYNALLFINVIFSIFTIILSHQLFSHFISINYIRWLFAIFSGLYWGHASYFQLTSDILGVTFSLLIIKILIRSGFYLNNKLNILLGIWIGLACLAKTYSFYITGLFLLLYFIYEHYKKQITAKQIIKSLLTIYIPAIIVLLPFVIGIHEKYNIWHFTIAGKLNSEWRLYGSPVLLDSIRILQPPVFDNSLSFWEDPFFHQGKWHSMFDSLYLFGRYLLRLVKNFTEWMDSINHFSFLYGATWLISIILLLKGNKLIKLNHNIKILMGYMIIYPFGLILVHLESRYIWITLPINLIITFTLLPYLLNSINKKIIRNLIYTFVIATYCSGMMTNVYNMINTGKQEYTQAKQLNHLGIKGSFFCNRDYFSGKYAKILRISYFSNSPVYYITKDNTTFREKLLDAKRYNVKYYFHFYSGVENNCTFYDLDGNPLIDVSENSIKGLKVFEL